MALPGITCPEKFIIPLYFKPEEQGELSKLFQKDSIIEQLWDPWRLEAVKAISYEDISLLKYMHSHFLSLKSPIFASLKDSKDRFFELVKYLINSKDLYSNILQETFTKNINALDNEIMINILKYYAVLEEHKRIAQLKYDHIASAIALKIEIEKLSKRLQELGLALQFETCNSIKLTKLDTNSQQFARCDKAVNENIRPNLFKDSGFISLKLCIAFKIENSSILKTFDSKIKSTENSILKGLFVPITKKQIPSICIFGFQPNEFIKNRGRSTYFKQICRMPSEFARRTKIDEFLTQCEGFIGDIHGSTSSTLLKDEEKIANSNNCLVLLVLCRAIVSRNKQDSGFNNETQEYKVTDFSNLYPEYVLICTKEKNVFEVVPNKHCIIPVKLTDLNYSNSSNSNKMSVDTFYTYVNKAIESSVTQRAKLKNELNTGIETFWSLKFKKDLLLSAILESKKRFIDKQKSDIENLKKDLIHHQRFSDSLRQLKSTRFKNLFNPT